MGYIVCSECSAAVLELIGQKTGGRCAECFRAATNKWFDEIIATTRDGERLRLQVHRSRRTKTERAQRRRWKQRARTRPEVRDRARLNALAQSRARARLTRLMPEVYEVMLADERVKLGLNGWSLERALTPHRLDESTCRLLEVYAARDSEQ